MSLREQFHSNPDINPHTGRMITRNKNNEVCNIYKKLVAEFGPPPEQMMESKDLNEPPEFMLPVPLNLKGEGYWSQTYMPIVSEKEWSRKQEWIDKVIFIELQAERKENDVKVMQNLGYAPSRLVPNFMVGSAEYRDGEVFWPEGYVEHYIRDHNVMPTKRFYNYINNKYDTLTIPFDFSKLSMK
jgi:hypothetical protein